MTVVAPALDGRQPLGFLAGLGVLRLLGADDPSVRLSWDERNARALFDAVGSIDVLVERLVAAFRSSDGLQPGLPHDVPPRKQGSSGGDPAHLTRSEFADVVNRVPADWACALWSDLGEDKNARCERTPFSAPMGQQTLRSMFEKPYELVADAPEQRLREALTGWARVAGFTGENFDIQALEEAAESQSGASQPSGVPGATWLALAAIPFFRMSGSGRVATTVAWSRNARRRRQLRWPLWSTPLDTAAVRVLLDHPAVSAPDVDRSAPAKRRTLGVFVVIDAERRPTSAGKSDGVLVPLRR